MHRIMLNQMDEHATKLLTLFGAFYNLASLNKYFEIVPIWNSFFNFPSICFNVFKFSEE